MICVAVIPEPVRKKQNAVGLPSVMSGGVLVPKAAVRICTWPPWLRQYFFHTAGVAALAAGATMNPAATAAVTTTATIAPRLRRRPVAHAVLIIDPFIRIRPARDTLTGRARRATGPDAQATRASQSTTAATTASSWPAKE